MVPLRFYQWKAFIRDYRGKLSPGPSSPVPLADGILLPRDATGLALWVHPSRPNPRLTLLARLQDAAGFYFDVEIATLDFRGWQRLAVDIVPRPPHRPEIPGKSRDTNRIRILSRCGVLHLECTRAGRRSHPAL